MEPLENIQDFIGSMIEILAARVHVRSYREIMRCLRPALMMMMMISIKRSVPLGSLYGVPGQVSSIAIMQARDMLDKRGYTYYG